MLLEYFADILLRIFVKTLFLCNIFVRLGIRIILTLYSNWEIFLFSSIFWKSWCKIGAVSSLNLIGFSLNSSHPVQEAGCVVGSCWEKQQGFCQPKSKSRSHLFWSPAKASEKSSPGILSLQFPLQPLPLRQRCGFSCPPNTLAVILLFFLIGRFHSYEMSRNGKCIETESRLVITWI